ncbi:hypothetical protein GCWU000325_00027 [Alloprevotella tannerae ATCC 51259]|uniref:Uncharacterized protein n=1 Tax=Alloprevotella tannerae ATCC 51259 TaxID=626522 RepID=C9LCT5_9BACT|nr:hypothetical protein GCWU000325_00027 [Alloprevotella tannerae ATCC 51259]
MFPFYGGNRAYYSAFCCAVEMFFSLLLFVFIIFRLPFQSAKLEIICGIAKH